MSNHRLLLIAGPSGAGKSEFIRQLREGRLPPAVRDLLPIACHDWPAVEANNMLKDGVGWEQLLAQSQVSGPAIVHYDITYIHRLGMEDYALDPFCKTLEAESGLLIIYLKPDTERLLKQFGQRLANHRASKGFSRLIWADWVRRPIKRASLRRRGLPTMEANDLYRLPGFVDNCYHFWEAHLAHLANGKREISVITLRPSRSASGSPSFDIDGLS